MAPQQGNPLAPTFEGYIGSTMDALILFEASLRGVISHVPRRPHDRERSQLIRSGNVFIYEEHSSGIKRWTDGVPWSPSRILGNFLLYRELDKPFQPGEKKRAMKRNKPEGVIKQTSNPRANSISAFGPGALASQTMTAGVEENMIGTELERAYIGSLVDSYQFKENGLIKKTISVTHKGVQHHLVSYYNLEDIKSRRLPTVRTTARLQGIMPSSSLLQCGSFRAPVDDTNLDIIDTRQFMTMATSEDYPLMPAVPPPRSMSIPPTQPYGHSQTWNTQQYGHNPGYTVPQMMQPSPIEYGHEAVMPAYSYDTTYSAPSRTSSFTSAMQPPRRHSVVPSSNGTSHLGYSTATPLLTNGSGLTTHGLSGSPYLNGGGMFAVSAANATLETTSTGSSGGNDASVVIDQSNGTNGINTPAPHNTSAFDGRLSGGYENPMGRLSINNFGGPLHDSAGTNFGPTSPGTSPTNLAISLDPARMPSPEFAGNPEDMEWNRTMVKNSDQW
ncbi:Gti1/Pac2 family-domain-containing protein [Xylaria longipes]|nr:Gti1/Pac2 family-domain-containing protein [Xylaria longipes]